MQKITLLLIIVLLVSGCTLPNASKTSKNISPMKLESPIFTHNQYLPTKYTCDGTGVNPPLKISNIPNTTKNIVLIVDDPDAPNGDFVHWLVWNIDPQTTQIEEESTPIGAIQGTGSSGTPKFVPPCPPTGVHRYFFKLYALDTKLNLPVTTNKTQLLNAMQEHILDQTEIIGLYSRK